MLELPLLVDSAKAVGPVTVRAFAVTKPLVVSVERVVGPVTSKLPPKLPLALDAMFPFTRRYELMEDHEFMTTAL